MALPTFNYQDWIAQYPELANFGNETIVTNMYLYQAGVQGKFVFTFDDIKNDADAQKYWLYRTLAHIVYCQQNGVLGVLNSASQGSESIGTAFEGMKWGAYWMKSVYGQDIYQLFQANAMGGIWFGDGNPPYNSDAMTGNYYNGGTGGSFL